MSNVRKHTNKLLELIDEGMFDKDDVISACLGALSEDDVAKMCLNNDMFLFQAECDECNDVFQYEGEVNEDGLCEECQAALDGTDEMHGNQSVEEMAYASEAEELLR